MSRILGFFKQKLMPLYMVTGLILGVLCGTYSPEVGTRLLPIGTAFLQAIKMLIVPLVVCSITLGIYQVSTRLKANRSLIAITFIYFLFATLFAAGIGLAVSMLLHPGEGFLLSQSTTIPNNLTQTINWTSYFLDLIPSNIVAAMTGTKVLPIIFFSSLFAMALASIGERAKPVIDIFESVQVAIFKMTAWIISVSPIAIFAIISWVIATHGSDTLLALGQLVGVTYLSLGILLLVFLATLKLVGDSPLVVMRGVWQPVLLAFTTSSSDVTLPLHMNKLVGIGVPKSVASALLPLGYAFNRCGATLYTALAVGFLANAYGLVLDWPTLIAVIVLSVIAINGAAAVPAGALVAITVVATGIGLPVEAIAIIAGIDAFVDMGRTAMNVFGNSVAIRVLTKLTNVSEPDETVSNEELALQPAPKE